MSFKQMFEGFDEVQPSFGFSDEPLPTGWYPVKLEKVLETQTSPKGSHGARVQLVVTEGDMSKKRAFVNVTMGPSEMNRDNTQRSEAEIAAAARNIQSQMRGLLKALGLNTGQPSGGTDLEKICSFFSVGQWEGREFMAYLKLRPETNTRQASNQLNAFAPADDPKKGLGAWRAKQGAGAPAAAAAAEI